MQIVRLKCHCLRIVVVPVYQQEVLLTVCYVVIIIALLSETFVAWECASIVRFPDNEVRVAVPHLLVVSVI